MTEISLLICTRNRAAQLQRCLDAVARLRCRHAWEAVLVDNGSTDATPSVLRNFAAAQPFRVIAVSEPRPGLGRARNAGIAASTGTILAFTDDDCYPRTDYLDRVVETFASRDVGWIGGMVVLHDETDFPLTVSLIARDLALPAGRYLWPGLIQGANMAFRRETLLAIGGFDPELGPGTPFIVDDIDAAARASAAGWPGGFFTAPVVSHHHGRKARDAAALTAIYDHGRGAYFAKLLISRATRRCFGMRIAAEACRSMIRRPVVARREIGGAIAYLARRRRAIAEPPAETSLRGAVP